MKRSRERPSWIMKRRWSQNTPPTSFPQTPRPKKVGASLSTKPCFRACPVRRLTLTGSCLRTKSGRSFKNWWRPCRPGLMTLLARVKLFWRILRSFDEDLRKLSFQWLKCKGRVMTLMLWKMNRISLFSGLRVSTRRCKPFLTKTRKA